MTKQQAIDILNDRTKTIDNSGVDKDKNWITHTAAFIEEIFGKESNEYERIMEFKFFQEPHASGDVFFVSKKKAKGFLDNCIARINRSKWPIKPKLNWLYTIDKRLLATIIVFVLGIIGKGCYEWGERSAEVKIDNLERKNQAQNDSTTNYKSTIEKLQQKLKIITSQKNSFKDSPSPQN